MCEGKDFIVLKIVYSVSNEIFPFQSFGNLKKKIKKERALFFIL